MSDDEQRQMAELVERVLAPHVFRILRWMIGGFVGSVAVVAFFGWQARDFVASIDKQFDAIHSDIDKLEMTVGTVVNEVNRLRDIGR